MTQTLAGGALLGTGLSTINPRPVLAAGEVMKGEFDYRDAGIGKIYGDQKTQNHMTLFGGEVVFDPWGLNSPFWKDAPPRSRPTAADPGGVMGAEWPRST